MTPYLTHTLWRPLEHHNTIELPVLTFGLYEQSHIQFPDDDEQRVEHLIQTLTGLTDEQLNSLSLPDYNTLDNAVREQVNHHSAYFFEQNGRDVATLISQEFVTLFDALADVDKVHWQVPTLKINKLLKTLIDSPSDPYKRSKFLTQHCAGLDDAQISQLSLRDWNQLQQGISDFLQQDAAYFATTT